MLTESRNVNFQTTVPIVETSISQHMTFMDTKGRTMLSLTALNVVDDLRDRAIIVTYDYSFLAGFRKPLTIVASVTALFVAAWGIGRLDVRISGKRL
jgi:oligosaccharyltransferase complex subunit alpha (ribophorin I)